MDDDMKRIHEDMKRVKELFGKYAGRKVHVKAKQITTSTLAGRFEKWAYKGNRFKPYTVIRPRLWDPTVLKMRFTAWSHGYRFFVERPGRIAFGLHLLFEHAKGSNTVTAGLVKGTDGKWCIDSGFGLG